MDRNLGALDDRYHAANQNMSKYYQWGRKDPFNCDIYCWFYDSETFAPTKSATANGMRARLSKAVIDSSDSGGFGTNGHNVPFSVRYPTTFICNGSEWSSTTDLFGGTKLENNKTTKYWNDPRPFIKIDNEEVSATNENKSFFDPCPLGWRLPLTNWEIGFRGDKSGAATGDCTINFQWGIDSEFRDRGTGRTYVPLGYLSQKGNQNAQTVFFPAFGYLSPTEGYLTRIGDHGNYMSCSPATAVSGHFLYFNPDAYYISTCYLGRAAASPARCLKE